jgi:hypothetical protein
MPHGQTLAAPGYCCENLAILFESIRELPDIRVRFETTQPIKERSRNAFSTPASLYSIQRVQKSF